MIELRQNFQNAPRDSKVPLRRLIRVCIGAEGHNVGNILRIVEFRAQSHRCIRFVKQLGFKIEPGRKAVVGVCRAGKAVDAAMFAAAIGIDRAVERHVGRGIAGDDGAGGIGGHRRDDLCGHFFLHQPAVIDGDAVIRLETARSVADRTTPLAGTIGKMPIHQKIIKNITRTFKPLQGCRHCGVLS